MAVDLLLEMDDDLIAVIKERAAKAGLPPEEIVREALMTVAGRPYVHFYPEAEPVMCPIVRLDLRQ